MANFSFIAGMVAKIHQAVAEAFTELDQDIYFTYPNVSIYVGNSRDRSLFIQFLSNQ
jgi:hypothetical protein